MSMCLVRTSSVVDFCGDANCVLVGGGVDSTAADWKLVVSDSSDFALKSSSDKSWACGRASPVAKRRLWRLPLRSFYGVT